MKNKITKLGYFYTPMLFLVWGLFQSSSVLAADATTMDKCETCHHVQATEFKASVHYINRSGVQAGCSDCHANFKHKDGNNTSSNVKKHRLDMAASEWKRMGETKSKACKSCHTTMAMDFAKQEPRSVTAHEKSFKAGETSCVKCHKGISHYLPDGWKEKAKNMK